MGGAIIGVTPAAIRAWLVRQVEGTVTSEVVRKMVWKFFRPAIFALVVELIAHLFKLAAQTFPPSMLTDFDGKQIKPNDMPRRASLVESLAKGFFKGYLINTMTDHLYKHLVVDTVERGVENIREVKMYLLTKRTYAAIDKVRDLIHTIEGQLDGPSMHKATLLFQETTSRLARAAGGLFAVLYHLPYEQAKDVLKTFGVDATGNPPSPEHWDAEAQVQLKKIIGTFQRLTNLSSIDEALEQLQTGRLLPVIGTIMVLESEIIWATETTFHHLPKKGKSFILIALGMLFAAGVVVAEVESDGDFLKVVADVGGDLFHLPDNDEDAAKVGELVGNVFGGFFFNSVMFDKGGLFHDFREKHTILGGALWGNVKASPIEAIISVLLKRYVLLYDHVKKDLQGLTRAAGEHAFVEAMHAMEDNELEEQGFGHLKSFRTEDEQQVSLQNIALTIFRIRHVVKTDLADWIKKRYENDIAKYKADLLALNELGTDLTKINVDQVLEKDVPHFYHLMGLQLNQTLDEIVATLRALFEPFSKGDLSWVTFLKALGVGVGDVKKIQKEIMDTAKAELAGLRQLTKAQ